MFVSISSSLGVGGFLPGMKQIGNVASLPGIVKVSKQYSQNVFPLKTMFAY